MKAAVSFARIIVGVLFIFSGLIKANDPLSLGYKMQEFFEIWNESLSKGSFFLNQPLIHLFDYLHAHSLTLSIAMIAFEIIAGAALLLGWRFRVFAWLMLLLILFFTFLTGYALLSGKFKNCGCFGDCLPISPKTSFLKDIILTLLIGFLFWKRRLVKPIFRERTSILTMLGVTAFSLGIQCFVLSYLPFMDCLPYKKGNNIAEKMKIPAGARPDSFAIRFVYEKEGKQFEFSPSELPKDLATYKFVSRVDKLIKKGNAEPPIKGFSLSGSTDEDSTQVVLSQPYAVLLFCENFSKPISSWKSKFAKINAEAKSKHIPVYMVTTQPREGEKAVSDPDLSGIQVFKCDYTAIRTAARTNPCIYLLKAGTIENKWSYKRMRAVLRAVKNIPVQQVPVPESTIPVTDTSQQH